MADERKICVRCNLDIQKQRYIRLPRKPRPGEDTNQTYWFYFHNRELGDCWTKQVAEAAARKKASVAPTQLRFPYMGRREVIQ